MVAYIFIFFTFVFASNAKIMRNNALMTKMVSNFRKDIEPVEAKDKIEPVLQRMQNLLCHNFQTVPCEMIMQDLKLRKLIEQSIQQINNKKHNLEKTTQPSSHLTLFPLASEDVSRHNAPKHKHRKKKEKRKFKIKDTRTVYNRKKIRKFYPHKVKYKDKKPSTKTDFDNSDEKLSMSVEVPDMTLTRRHQHVQYKVEPADPPVWRIDYMKHEEPGLNMFGFESRLKDKLMRNNIRNGVVDDGSDERKEVIHPDLYIKKTFARKDNVNLHSDILE